MMLFPCIVIEKLKIVNDTYKNIILGLHFYDNFVIFIFRVDSLEYKTKVLNKANSFYYQLIVVKICAGFIREIAVCTYFTICF